MSISRASPRQLHSIPVLLFLVPVSSSFTGQDWATKRMAAAYMYVCVILHSMHALLSLQNGAWLGLGSAAALRQGGPRHGAWVAERAVCCPSKRCLADGEKTRWSMISACVATLTDRRSGRGSPALPCRFTSVMSILDLFPPGLLPLSASLAVHWMQSPKHSILGKACL